MKVLILRDVSDLEQVFKSPEPFVAPSVVELHVIGDTTVTIPLSIVDTTHFNVTLTATHLTDIKALTGNVVGEVRIDSRISSQFIVEVE